MGFWGALKKELTFTPYSEESAAVVAKSAVAAAGVQPLISREAWSVLPLEIKEILSRIDTVYVQNKPVFEKLPMSEDVFRLLEVPRYIQDTLDLYFKVPEALRAATADTSLIQQLTMIERGLKGAVKRTTNDYAIKALETNAEFLKNIFPEELASDEPVAIATEAKQSALSLLSFATQYGDEHIGQLIPNKGIYMGVWQPIERDGTSLNKKYHVFAAPTDLTDNKRKKLILTFRDAAKAVGKLIDWHGHKGLYVENDTKLYKILKGNSYGGEWFLPTRELLHGKDVDGNPVDVKNLLKNKDKGAFAGTFTLDRGGSVDFPHWYWSLTENREVRDYVWVVRLSDGNVNWFHKVNFRLSSRPVRLELVI